MHSDMQVRKALSHHASAMPDGQYIFRCFNDVLRFLGEVNQTSLDTLERERDSWMHTVGLFMDTIPTNKILGASGTVKDAITYFKNIQEECTTLRARVLRSEQEHPQSPETV